ncbi:MAG: hypothetical protein A4E28_02924 [Methanocella sp. PtaU1.Bin125]|nr:MAG: hypothetical protein A4E28_02924 [Methanocella sp. PtaU1.Bin125]
MYSKPEMRILGVDDSPLVSKDILVIGAIMRGGSWLDGLLSTHIERDGTDATERIAAMISGSRASGQIRVIMLNGVTFGGFNVVDIEALHRLTGLPVIAVMRKLPDLERIRSALAHLSEPERRYELIARAGNIWEVQTRWRGGPVYYQCKGIEKDDAARLIVDTAIHSRLPEPIRVAHIIATGVVLGESSPRA